MNFLNNLSLRSKLTFIAMIACIFALVLAGAGFIIYDHQQMKSNMVKDFEILGDVIGANCTAAIAFNNTNDATETLASLVAEKTIEAACVYRHEGSIQAQYSRVKSDNIEFPESTVSQGHNFGANYLEIFRDIILEREKTGVVYLKISLKPLDDRLSSIIMAVSLVIMCTLVIVLIIVSRLQKIVSQPILNLATTAKQISGNQDYSVRVPIVGQDEVGTLVEQFNKMLKQIQTRDIALQESQNKLEDRVNERTLELQEEVLEHERSKDRIAASLKEKETLLKEVHHRVKNNLQIITSLLSLQAGEIADSETHEMFRDSMGRVKSMALIHERLYQSENLAEVEFADYVDSLMTFLMSTVTGNLGRITLTNHVKDIVLPVDIAVPCGLIINELVTNTLKYAFPYKQSGEVSVSCTTDGNNGYSLSVCDNGVGLPDEIDLQSIESLGMRLVQSLTEQLDGKLTLNADQGTQITIEFESALMVTREEGHVTV